LGGEVKGLVAEVIERVYSNFHNMALKWCVGFDVVVDPNKELKIVFEKK
jgi:hypothetical protein